MTDPAHTEPMTIETLHTDDDWRIDRHDNRIWMSHCCEEGPAEKHWFLMWTDVDARNWYCGACTRRPSHGLQASFWFLKEEA